MRIEKIYLLSGIFIGIVLGVITGFISGVAVYGLSWGTLEKYASSAAISVGTLVFILSVITTYKIGKNTRQKENFIEQKEIKRAKIILAASITILFLMIAGAVYIDRSSPPPPSQECIDLINKRSIECANKCYETSNQVSCFDACNKRDFFKECK